jgi:MerR family mercuric resistance operon transcriptional regulator
MKRMTIGSLAVAAGTRITTIRYYERAGLLPVPTRTPGSHRSYAEEELRRVLFIRRARELGFSVADTKMLLVLAEPSRVCCRDVQQIATAHLQRLRRKIAVLRRLEGVLAQTLAHCSGRDNAPCPVLDLLTADESSFQEAS